MKSRRRVNSTVMPRRFLKNRERAMLELVVAVAAIARDEAAGAVRNAECGRALCISLNGSARYAWAWDNKSLDASGITLLAIDNLSVTWLTAAASTLTFDSL